MEKEMETTIQALDRPPTTLTMKWKMECTAVYRDKLMVGWGWLAEV